MVYFPVLGVVSVVADLGQDQTVETATIGRESMVGMSVYLGAGAPTERSLVQVAGQALATTAEDFRAGLADVDGPLSVMLRRAAQTLFTQVFRKPPATASTPCANAPPAGCWRPPATATTSSARPRPGRSPAAE